MTHDESEDLTEYEETFRRIIAKEKQRIRHAAIVKRVRETLSESINNSVEKELADPTTLVSAAATLGITIDPDATSHGSPTDSACQSEPSILYPTLDRWVEEWLAPVYEQRISSGRAWCPQWWKHDGAVARFMALWAAWENLRVEGGPTGMATWFVQFADPIMHEVLRADGIFSGCKDDPDAHSETHRTQRPHKDGALPTTPIPDGLFTPR